jgi:hypothetical protein
MKKNFYLTLIAGLILFQSCSSMSGPYPGHLYTDVKYTNYVSNEVIGSKKGVSCSNLYLALFSTGDVSVVTTAQKAGINKITHVDHKSYAILPFWGIMPLYNKFCVEVYGEYVEPKVSVKETAAPDVAKANKK